MLDLVEGSKIIQALAPTTAGTADDGDYISMANAHAVWTIVSFNDGTSALVLTPKTASAYAGTGAAAVDGGCQIWYNVNTTQLDRMTKSANTTAYEMPASATLNSMAVIKYDPANAPSSHPYFAMTASTGGAAATGRLAMTYIVESRYPGYQQVISTTSST